MLDEIDIKILEGCNQNPGQPLITILKPLLPMRRERTLYDRAFALEVQQFISVDRSQKKVALAKITEKGRQAITGREKPAAEEARSP